MDYILAFLEGIITFISPCLLPMLPIYLLYFAGEGGQSRGRTLANALAFVLGFTVVFLALGALAGTLGGLLIRHQRVVNLVAGAIVILFGLDFLGLFQKLFGRGIFVGGGTARGVKITGFVSAFVFGLVFSISWTPCVGVFLGSALMLASVQGSVGHGILMLLCYSAGLGIPFVLSAVLLDKLKAGFDFIKRHYTLINRICGVLLLAVGLLMATGLLGRFLTFLA